MDVPLKTLLAPNTLGPAPCFMETSRGVARKRKQVASPAPAPDSDLENAPAKARMLQCGSQQSLCLVCDKITENRRNGTLNCMDCKAEDMPADLRAALHARWQHRGLMICDDHAEAFLAMIKHFDNQNLENHEVLKDPIRAIVDRDFDTGCALGIDGAYIGFYSRKTCKSLFDMHSTSQRIRRGAAELCDDDTALVKMIRTEFSKSSFTAKSAATSSGDVATAGPTQDSLNIKLEFTPDGLADFPSC